MLVASQVLKADLGTRFVQITSNDGWDMHTNIYAANNLPAKAKIIDDGLSALINDLKANGLFDKTLIVMYGEFGRTVGPITAQGGRDHWPQQFCFFAGGGIKGGTVVGQTDARGARHRRLRLVAESLCVSGGYRGDDLLGARDRLDDGAARRSAGARLRVCTEDRSVPVHAGSRTLGVTRRAGPGGLSYLSGA